MGKTEFALAAAREVLAKKPAYQGIDLISADSRQVYRGLETLSGADLPVDFERIESDQEGELTYPYYQKNRIRLHGVSFIEPDQDWSVAHFHRLFWEVLPTALAEKRLVLVVGGTGLYHEQLLNFDPALQVGPNQRVRAKAKQMTVRALQDWAAQVNPERFEQMNRSDRYNPRRLIRVIEIGLAEPPEQAPPAAADQLEQLYVGLEDDLILIERRIQRRAEQRLAEGALTEVQALMNQVDQASVRHLPALTTLGVESLASYLVGEIDRETALERWVLHEVQYARKQLQWWEGKSVQWFKLTDPGWKRAAFTYILESCSNFSKDQI